MFSGQNNQNQWAQSQNNMASPFNTGATQGIGSGGTQGFGTAPTQGYGAGVSQGFSVLQQQNTYVAQGIQAQNRFSNPNQSQLFGGQTAQKIYSPEKFEIELQHQFSDSISQIIVQKLESGSNQGRYICAASCWDGKLQIFEILTDQNQHHPNQDANQINAPIANQGSCIQTQGPILGICFLEQTAQNHGFGFGSQNNSKNPNPIFIAHSDGMIKIWDPNNPGNQPINLGQHTQPVKDVYSFTQNGQIFLVSAGWDCMVKFWQIQGNSPNMTLNPIGETWVGKPIHQMSGQFPLLVTSHSEKFIHIWNLETMFQGKFTPVHVVESPLRFTSSTISCFSDGKGYAVGSIEGRCGIVNVDLKNLSKIDNRDFCFKCHRQEDAATKEGDVYTVNCISFNKAFNTFVSAGSDGQWFTWNKDTKSRYKQSTKSQMPITSTCFSEDAMILVHAHGEDWSLGAAMAQKRQNLVRLYVRRCEKDDVFKAPKNK